MPKHLLVVVLGPTASGKTNMAVRLASTFNGQIISADSRQVYQGMDIGTGKDLDCYVLNGRKIKYHLIDILKAGETYHVANFQQDFAEAFSIITQQGDLPILCGGTGMYINSVLLQHHLVQVPINPNLRELLATLSKEDLRRQLHTYPSHLWQHADLSSVKRLIRAIEIAHFAKDNPLPPKNNLPFEPLILGIKSDVEVRRANILSRLALRLKAGLIAEVEQLIASGVSPDKLVYYGLEYKFVANYLAGAYNYQTLQQLLGTAICQYAKRQMTFFRKMEKDGLKIHWLQNIADAENRVANYLDTNRFLH